MASDLVTTGARRAYEGIQAVKTGLPPKNQAGRTLCSQLQGLIQRVSTAEQGRTLAERQVEDLRGRLSEAEEGAAEGQEAARRRIGQLELQLGQVQDLADTRVEEAKRDAEARAGHEKAFATLQAIKAQEANATAHDDLDRATQNIEALAAQILPLREENEELRARLAQARALLPTKSEAKGRIDHFRREQCKDAKRIDDLKKQVTHLQRRLRESEAQRTTEGDSLSREAEDFATKNRELQRTLETTKRTLQEVQNRHQEEMDEIMGEMQTLNTSTERQLSDMHKANSVPIKPAEVTQLQAELAEERQARAAAETVAKEQSDRRRDAEARGAEEERARISTALLCEGTPFARLYNQLTESGMKLPSDPTDPIALANAVAEYTKNLMLLAADQAQEPGGSS